MPKLFALQNPDESPYRSSCNILEISRLYNPIPDSNLYRLVQESLNSKPKTLNPKLYKP